MSMGDTGVTLDQHSQLTRDLERLTALVNQQGDIVRDLHERMAVLQAMDEKHALLCPYQVDIRRASNNLARIDKIENAFAEYAKAVNEKLGSVDRHMTKTTTIFGMVGVLVGGLLIPFIQSLMGL